jgi:hypothetical protein
MSSLPCGSTTWTLDNNIYVQTNVSREFHPSLCPMCWSTKKFMPHLVRYLAPWNSKRSIYNNHSIQILCYLYIFNKILIIFFGFELSICIFSISHHYPLVSSLHNNDNQINNYKWETIHNWMDNWKHASVVSSFLKP